VALIPFPSGRDDLGTVIAYDLVVGVGFADQPGRVPSTGCVPVDVSFVYLFPFAVDAIMAKLPTV